MQLTIRKIGNSLGLILNKETIARLKLKEGDALFVLETHEGITLTPFDPEFAEALRIAEEGMGQYKNALRELAK